MILHIFCCKNDTSIVSLSKLIKDMDQKLLWSVQKELLHKLSIEVYFDKNIEYGTWSI